MNLPWAIENLKIQWEIIFFNFFKYWSKRSKRNLELLLYSAFWEICFWEIFCTLGSAWTENAESAATRHFQFKHFPKFKMTSESRFLKKYYIITIPKKIGAFWSVYKKKSKNRFPIVFSNFQSPRADLFLRDRPWYIRSYRSHFSHIISMRATKSKQKNNSWLPPPIDGQLELLERMIKWLYMVIYLVG